MSDLLVHDSDHGRYCMPHFEEKLSWSFCVHFDNNTRSELLGDNHE